jgi:hypothetical protein
MKMRIQAETDHPALLSPTPFNVSNGMPLMNVTEGSELKIRGFMSRS